MRILKRYVTCVFLRIFNRYIRTNDFSLCISERQIYNWDDAFIIPIVFLFNLTHLLWQRLGHFLFPFLFIHRSLFNNKNFFVFFSVLHDDRDIFAIFVEPIFYRNRLYMFFKLVIVVIMQIPIGYNDDNDN